METALASEAAIDRRKAKAVQGRTGEPFDAASGLRLPTQSPSITHNSL